MLAKQLEKEADEEDDDEQARNATPIQKEEEGPPD